MFFCFCGKYFDFAMATTTDERTSSSTSTRQRYAKAINGASARQATKFVSKVFRISSSRYLLFVAVVVAAAFCVWFGSRPVPCGFGCGCGCECCFGLACKLLICSFRIARFSAEVVKNNQEIERAKRGKVEERQC